MIHKILTTFTVLLISFGTYADVSCNNAEISIVRGTKYGWGGQESFFQTADPKIQQYIGDLTSIRGYLLQTRFKKIEGEFDYVKSNWSNHIPGYSITLTEIRPLQNNSVLVLLKVRRSPMVGCLEYRNVSGCYAWDGCVQECESEINIPEQILFKTTIICEET